MSRTVSTAMQEQLLQSWINMSLVIRGNRMVSGLSFNEMIICRILLDRLAPYVADVIDEGVRDGSFHARRPMEVGRLLLLLALDTDEEACRMLAAEPDNPDAAIGMLELLNAWRDAAENLIGAPYGSIRLFDAAKMVADWQAAAALMKA